MVRHRLCAALILLGLGLESSGVRAESETVPSSQDASGSGTIETRLRAKQLYEEGLAAYHAGHYSDAIDQLLAADKTLPNAAFSYNIALVYEAMGDQRSALRWLRGYLRQKGEGADEAETLAKVRSLEAELQARGLQQLTVLSKPVGATLKVDGAALGVTPFTTELTPGSHQITVTLDGFQNQQRLVELRPDRSMDVEVELVASPPIPDDAVPTDSESSAAANARAVPIVATVPAAPTAENPGSMRVKPLTWVSLGVGAALLGGALYYEMERQKAEDEAKRASQETYQSRFDAIGPPQTKARVLGIAGVAVMATGVVLLTVDLTKHGPVVAANVAISPGAVTLRGQF